MGDTWKNIRSTFTPIFTSGKMKAMLPLIREVSGQLTDELARKAEAGQEFNLKEVYGKYSLDGLASCAFGVDAQSFTNEKSVFVKYAADIFTEGVMDNLGFLMKLLPGMGTFMELFNINTFKKTPTKYFRDMILKTLEARRKSKERRNDLIDLMLDCLDKAEEQSEDEGFAESKEQFDRDQKFSHNKDGARISEDDVVATAMVLLVAGNSQDQEGNGPLAVLRQLQHEGLDPSPGLLQLCVGPGLQGGGGLRARLQGEGEDTRSSV